MTQGETILLRILATQDHHAYELDRLFDVNRMRQWADLGFSSIYSTLDKLERKGLVTSRREPEQAGPARRVYSITAAGRAEVGQEILRLLTGRPDDKDPGTVGIILSSFLGEEEFRAGLAARRDMLLQRLESCRGEIPAEARGRERIHLALQRVRALTEAELSWLEELLATLDAQDEAQR